MLHIHWITEFGKIVEVGHGFKQVELENVLTVMLILVIEVADVIPCLI